MSHFHQIKCTRNGIERLTMNFIGMLIVFLVFSLAMSRERACSINDAGSSVASGHHTTRPFSHFQACYNDSGPHSTYGCRKKDSSKLVSNYLMLASIIATFLLLYLVRYFPFLFYHFRCKLFKYLTFVWNGIHMLPVLEFGRRIADLPPSIQS